MRIGQVAKRTGLDVRLIRHYEKIGLIPPPRRSGVGYASAGYRVFTEEHVQQLQFVVLCRLLDLPLREIRMLLRRLDDECCASARPHLRQLLADKLHDVDSRITHLQDLRRRLEGYLQRLPEGAQRQETLGCAPTKRPIECAFDDTPRLVHGEGPMAEATRPLTLQRLETLDSKRSVRGRRSEKNVRD